MRPMRAYSIHTDHLTVVRITRRGGRRKCHCGCGRRATHYLAADGCNMGEGCEWSVWRRLRMLRPRGEAKFWFAGEASASPSTGREGSDG